ARTAPDPLVREAACRALAKIAHPSAEEALVAALQDQAAAVRFSAAQGLGNIGRAADPTVEALAARLQDDNKGVRQAVAAALAKLGGAEAARKMADRLKPGAEADPAVRNALWTAVLSIAQAGASPELAYELGSRFFALEGAEAMQRAAALYEIAQAKYPASDVGTQKVRALLERLVDAYVAGGMLEKAAPVLRQLLAETPPENPQRRQELKQQLGLILLEKGPYAEAGALLAEAVAGLGPAERGALLKAVLARTEALLQTDKPESALELLDAFRKAPAEGPPDQAEAFARLRDRATTAAVARAIANLSGSDDQVQAATAALKKIGRPAVGELLVALASAATDGRVAVETKILAALEAVTQRTDHGYDPAAPLADRLRTIEAWRASLPAPAANPSRP
ncbi:MAG: HEAT repeat domain-containing protein, partial [Phycisphaerae bacterium]